jgi:cytohesin
MPIWIFRGCSGASRTRCEYGNPGLARNGLESIGASFESGTCGNCSAPSRAWRRSGGPRRIWEYAIAYRIANSGELAVVRVLLEHGVDVNAKEFKLHYDNSTPLHDALNNPGLGTLPSSYSSVVQLLRRPWTDDRNTPLHIASDSGELAVVRVLLEHGVDVNAKDKGNSTPLHNALKEGHVDIAQLLLQRGADPEVRDEDMNTPLHLASYSGELAVVRVLLEHGVDVNTKDKDNSTPLHDALQQGHVEIAQLLLEHGTDVNAQDSNNRTPLYLASEEGYLGIVRLLLQRNSDIHVRDENGQTPFQRASARGHQDVMQLLLEHGAEEDAVEK